MAEVNPEQDMNMTLKEVLYDARKRVFDAALPSKSPLYSYDVYWAHNEWRKFLEARGITKSPRKDWPMVAGGPLDPDLYVPPEVAVKMLVLGYLP